MPNPDGTRTRDEIRRAIIHRMMGYILDDGMDPDEALTKASLDVQVAIQTEGAMKTAEVLRALGIKKH